MNKWWWVKRAVRWLFFAFRSRKIVVSCHWVKNRNFLWYNSVDAYALVRTVFCRSNRKKTKLKIEWCGNVNRLFDTKGMNRILGKPLKTRGSGTLDVAGIPCLILELCQGSTGAAVTDGHSGHKSDPSVAVLTPAAKGLTPMAVNVTPVVTVLTPPLVQCDPSAS